MDYIRRSFGAHRGIRLEHPEVIWSASGGRLDYSWRSFGLSLDAIWIASGGHLDYTRRSLRLHLEVIWSTSGSYFELHLEVIWITSGSHLDYVWWSVICQTWQKHVKIQHRFIRSIRDGLPYPPTASAEPVKPTKMACNFGPSPPLARIRICEVYDIINPPFFSWRR